MIHSIDGTSQEMNIFQKNYSKIQIYVNLSFRHWNVLPGGGPEVKGMGKGYFQNYRLISFFWYPKIKKISGYRVVEVKNPDFFPIFDFFQQISMLRQIKIKNPFWKKYRFGVESIYLPSLWCKRRMRLFQMYKLASTAPLSCLSDWLDAQIRLPLADAFLGLVLAAYHKKRDNQFYFSFIVLIFHIKIDSFFQGGSKHLNNLKINCSKSIKLKCLSWSLWQFIILIMPSMTLRKT